MLFDAECNKVTGVLEVEISCHVYVANLQFVAFALITNANMNTCHTKCMIDRAINSFF